MHVHTHMHMRMRMHMHVHTHMHVHMRMYMRMHTRTRRSHGSSQMDAPSRSCTRRLVSLTAQVLCMAAAPWSLSTWWMGQT